MNCYNHPEKPAVGLCKSCYKGLCVECAATLPNGLACRQTCEERVALINKIIENNQKVVFAANAQVRTSAIFSLVLGVVLFIPFLISGNTGLLVMAVPGLVFVVYGIIRLLRKSQYYPTTK